MPIHKRQHEAHREFVHLQKRSGPDCRGHRYQVIIHEHLTQTVPADILAQSQVRHGIGLNIGDCLFVECENIHKHFDICRRQQVSALGKETVIHRQSARYAGILKATGLAADTKTHIRIAPGDTQLIHQGNEIRISPVVVDNKAGINLIPAFIQLKIDCCSMAAKSVSRLVDGNIVGLRQLISCRQTRYSSADNCYLQNSPASGGSGVLRQLLASDHPAMYFIRTISQPQRAL